MANGSGNSCLSLIIQRHHPNVIQRQLQPAGALLFGNKSGGRPVNLVDDPVFARHRFQLQHNFQERLNIILGILKFRKLSCCGTVFQNRFGNAAKHISQLPVNGLLTGF